jgi:hypothetical protein
VPCCLPLSPVANPGQGRRIATGRPGVIKYLKIAEHFFIAEPLSTDEPHPSGVVPKI